MEKKNQRELIELIANTLSKIEKEDYSVIRVNASNIPYKLYGKPLLKGNLFIIGNPTFLKRIKYRYRRKPSDFLSKNYRLKLSKYKSLLDENSKGIIFLFNEKEEANEFKFKKIVGINNTNYAYLDAINDMYTNHRNNNPEKHMDNYFNYPEYIFTNKKRTKKKLIKILNK